MSVRYSKHLPSFVFFCDWLLLNIALYISYLVVHNTYSPISVSRVFVLLFNVAWVLVSIASKNYTVRRPLVLKDNINRFLSTLIYHLLLVFAVIYFFEIYDISKSGIVMGYSLFSLFIVVQRCILFFMLDYYRKRGYNHRQILIIGDEGIAARLMDSLKRHSEYGYDLVDFISEDQLSTIPQDALSSKILSSKPDEIVICYKMMDEALLQHLIRLGDDNFIKIKVVSGLLLNDNHAELVNYDNLPVLLIKPNSEVSNKILLLKRCFDVTFSVAVMTIGSPIFLILLLITKTTSKGPAFYRQERIGRNGKPFYIYKFRSMRIDAEKFGPQLSRDNDPRITKWGNVMRKTRLDELPQFWNVIKGEMSVVGPRPERQHFIEKIVEKTPNYKKLLRLKPGITSIGQVHYGYAENIDQMCTRMRYDLLYLQNINLNSDLDIIYKTVKVMIKRKGK
ncbi:sugar transferase [Mucilaginibacter gotjawali]|uniref:Colanic acid biosynthesis UDP-glucose lipid carrier transferase n=2 Tax=Mucilaginibacter gotjawali TaxID=1550579 RepID=A0A839SMS4_9SPHI|nr:sugar transferase [Mucilaginibacter gotjawali]MBB3058534.1 putative colanic acid biosynthesis UDP-glucose lipid carrier transferase [Mucilaginibacter gotjawali]BAU55758.1 UDP-glucose:undecaprenyl-phosphate glucose-1-phosphate transferase [Mucilaginibacter gotjawali]